MKNGILFQLIMYSFSFLVLFFSIYILFFNNDVPEVFFVDSFESSKNSTINQICFNTNDLQVNNESHYIMEIYEVKS